MIGKMWEIENWKGGAHEKSKEYETIAMCKRHVVKIRRHVVK